MLVFAELMGYMAAHNQILTETCPGNGLETTSHVGSLFSGTPPSTEAREGVQIGGAIQGYNYYIPTPPLFGCRAPA